MNKAFAVFASLGCLIAAAVVGGLLGHFFNEVGVLLAILPGIVAGIGAAHFFLIPAFMEDR